MASNNYASGEWMPGISVDCVIFGFHENQLKVLTLRFNQTDIWSLPGGFVGVQEDLDAAAKRVLLERTGLSDIYLEQFHTFGCLKRIQEAKKQHKEVGDKMGRSQDDYDWISGRFITTGYFALVDFKKVIVNVGEMSDAYAWQDIQEVGELFLDHSEILQFALQQLRLSLDIKLVAFNLLTETFTMSEVQSLYETILGKPLVRTNFQRKMLSMDILERIEKKYTGGAHKAPYVYRLKRP
jgi:ADP-ribose pyrophosphatase YjhB (NUDIX family)